MDSKEMKMDYTQFSETLSRLRKKTVHGQKQTSRGSGLIPDARKVSANEEEVVAANDNICKQLFAGKKYCTLKDFITFRDSLNTSLRHYEFH